MGIIALSGAIGSGKDTVGAIIQYLIWKKQVEKKETINIHNTLQDFLEGRIYSEYEIKKFAGKLKQICSILTGIPVEDFEKQSVKDSYLGDEWVKYGISNEHLNPDKYGYVSSFEEAIELANTVGEHIKFIQKYRMTVRDLLQQAGTNALRNIIHPNIWVNALFNDYILTEVKTMRGIATPKNNGTWIVEVVPHESLKHLIGKEIQNPVWEAVVPTFMKAPNWIITDCRFPNEASKVIKMNGLLIRIERPDIAHNKIICIDCNNKFDVSEIVDNLSPCCSNTNYEILDSKLIKHSSETALDDYKFDYVIINDGSLDDLVEKVKQILISENLL